MPPTIPVAPRPLARLAYLSSGTPEAEAARAAELLRAEGEAVYDIGRVARGARGVRFIQ